MHIGDAGFEKGELKNSSDVTTDQTLDYYTEGILTYTKNWV